MKPMELVKTLGLVLALAGATVPTIVASSTTALARGDGGGGGAGGGGGGGAGGSGDGGATGGGGGFASVAPARTPPIHIPPGRGRPIAIRSIGLGPEPPSCIDYRRGMYSYYGYPIPVRCQPYLYPYSID
ncbi:MAG: hypothetical protein ACHQAY_28020 [Hyphomicrobiales bacterium]